MVCIRFTIPPLFPLQNPDLHVRLLLHPQ